MDRAQERIAILGVEDLTLERGRHSGREPFGGRILSHDYVEAALMRRIFSARLALLQPDDRDKILAVSGRLDRTLGGPPVPIDEVESITELRKRRSQLSSGGLPAHLGHAA
mgnify:CR=1 FL=1